MAQVEKTIFISYRRESVAWAIAIFQALTKEKFDVFFDYQSINAGSFEKVIMENIAYRAHFLVLLTPTALKDCRKPNDWLRKEIEAAIDKRRNIIPLMIGGFDFGAPETKQALTGKLALLNQYNGLRVHADYFFEAMTRLQNRYLCIPVEDVRQPELSPEVEKITEEQKKLAKQHQPIEEEQLTAVEWAIRGYEASHRGEKGDAIRFYQKAIQLDPEYALAHHNLGSVLDDLRQYQEAVQAYRKAIQIDSKYVSAYNNLGRIFIGLEEYQKAEQAYRKAIQIDPEYAYAYNGLGYALYKLGQYQEAEQAYRIAIQLDPEYDYAYNGLGFLFSHTNRYEEAQQALFKAIQLDPTYSKAHYNMACLRSLQNRLAEGFDWLQKAFDLEYDGTNYAWQDPDIENLRTANPARFAAIVGPKPTS